MDSNNRNVQNNSLAAMINTQNARNNTVTTMINGRNVRANTLTTNKPAGRFTRCFDIGGSGIKTALFENGSFQKGSFQHLGIVPPSSSIEAHIRKNIDTYAEELENPAVDFFISSAGWVNMANKSIEDDWKGGGIPRNSRDWEGKKSYSFADLFGIPDKRLTVCSDNYTHALGVVYREHLSDGIYCSIALGTGVTATLFEICNGSVFFLTPLIFAESSRIPTSFSLTKANSLYQSVDIWDFLGSGTYPNGGSYGLMTLAEKDKSEIASARLHHLISYIRFKFNATKTTKDVRGSDIKFYVSGGTTNIIDATKFKDSHIITDDVLPMLAYNYFKAGNTIQKREIKSLVLCPPVTEPRNKGSVGGARRKSRSTKRIMRRKTRKAQWHKRGGFIPIRDLYNINEGLKPSQMFGFETIEKVYGLNREDIIRSGVFFNISTVEHSEDFIVGVGRMLVFYRGKDDLTLNGKVTTIVDRHPYSMHHPWRSGWRADDNPHFDLPIFFITAANGKTLFFTMNYTLTMMSYKTNTLIKQFTQGTSLEDPRIAKCNDIYLLYCHTGVYSGAQYAEAGIGKNRKNTSELKPGAVASRAQLPIVSYIHTSFIDEITRAAMTETLPKTLSLPNSNWKSLCANFLPPSTEKNFAIIPRENHNRFDFIFSLGKPVTQSLVVFQMPLTHLISYSSLEESCGYMESISGKLLQPKLDGLQLQNTGTNFKKEQNSIFSLISTRINAYAGIILTNLITDLQANILQSIPEWTEYVNTIPSGTKYLLELNKLQLPKSIELDGKTLPSLLKQISSGGPMAKKVNGDGSIDAREVLGIGHLKMDYILMYLLYIYSNIIIKIGAKFDNPLISIIVNDDSIFKYNFDYINKMPIFLWGMERRSIVEISQALSTHANLMYTSFIFKLDLEVYTITAVSKQFLITDNSNLEFISTIANIKLNGTNGYMIPYGEADAQGKIYFAPASKIADFLKSEYYTSDIFDIIMGNGAKTSVDPIDKAISLFLKFDIMSNLYPDNNDNL